MKLDRCDLCHTTTPRADSKVWSAFIHIGGEVVAEIDICATCTRSLGIEKESDGTSPLDSKRLEQVLIDGLVLLLESLQPIRPRPQQKPEKGDTP